MALKQYSKDAVRTVIHRTITLPVDWYEFVTRLEHRLGRFNQTALDTATTLDEMEAVVQGMRKKEPFSIYAIYDHGVLSTVGGVPKRGKQYVIGNSRLATSMTVFDFRAAQSLPISNLIWEPSPGHTAIEFEVASSMLAALTDNDKDVAGIAPNIDEFRELVINKVFEDVKAGRVGGNGL